ncbi:dynein heavy chain 6, axonemal, partial [Asbolus verrucosus]
MEDEPSDMFGDINKSRQSCGSAEADAPKEQEPEVRENSKVEAKLLCKPVQSFHRASNIIPFHIPHKKLLENIEDKREFPEPLCGFSEIQQDLLSRKRSASGDINYSTSEEESSVGEGKNRGSKMQLFTLRFKRGSCDVSIASQPVLPHSKLNNVMDQTEWIKKMRDTTDGYFIYLTYTVPKSSELYSPYALSVVPYNKVDKRNFFTMSSKGVMQHTGIETVFTSLDKWEMEYKMYCKLMHFRTFYLFRLWKGFYVWRKSVVRKKYTAAQKHIAENLFILNNELRTGLLNIQHMCVKMNDASFIDDECIEDFFLFYFIERQMEKLEIISEKLEEFREVAKDIVLNSCHGALLAKGCQKTSRCSVRKSFIILTDYLMINLMHNLISLSTTELKNILENHFKFLPSQSYIETVDLHSVIEEPRPENAPQLPLFIVNVILDSEKLSLDPSLQVTLDIFNQIMDLWREHCKTIKSFVADEVYRPFTHPIINGKEEPRICGYGPTLTFYLDEDRHLAAEKNEIITYFTVNYELAHLYVDRFDFIREFFAEDELVKEDQIKEERDIETFRNMCNRYQKEIDIIDDVILSQALGILNLQLKDFKDASKPEPERLTNALTNILPWIGKIEIDKLVEQSEEMEKKLNQQPVTTVDYVNYLEYLDDANGKLNDMETQLDYCKDLYDIMEEFHIPVPDEDMSSYLGVSVTMASLRNLVDKKIEDTKKIIKSFNDQMNKDISALISEVGTIKDECMQPWLYDIDSNIGEVTEFLNDLYDRLVDCQRRAGEFKGYQKQFRLEVTRFDILDEVMSDVKLRMLLWESVTSWSKTLDEWYHCDFNELNVDDMNLFTAKTIKNITLLEKGLPKNLIVPKLKDDVELMKTKLPVVAYLRNQSLRQRHWIRVENILGYKFRPDETLTLELLENLLVFKYGNELQEISGQASSEAGLEALLKKAFCNNRTSEFETRRSNQTQSGRMDKAAGFIFTNPGPNNDEWTACQQSWIYLEVIFSAPDIQRQLPNESKLFLIVDKSWKQIMRRTAKIPLAMEAALHPGLLEELEKNNALLEQIMKCLESYLEVKRVAFPRFYFLSNDELLEILAQTKNPHAVQPHLRKCFDAIAKLEFASKEDEGAPAVEGEAADLIKKKSVSATTILTTNIVAMISPEGERVTLGKGLKARGNVEDWLAKVEASMFLSLRRLMKASLADYEESSRLDWMVRHPNQITLTVSQIMWARGVHEILDHPNAIKRMEKYERKCVTDLNDLAVLIRTDLPSVTRKVLIALITIDVHARDTIHNMVENKVQKSGSFDWLKVLRYYWDDHIDDCVARMSSAYYVYGYEYLGASGVLVITPLTDRCYLCLMGALQLDLGGAPAGPAGTGKTETTKDLAKALAIQCVVFNCSEGLDYKMMGRFFSGLAQSGAWCCFDEFNRIDIEVLSVIAQQIITIRNAKAAKLARFMFEGREIKLVQKCAAFITMNPGYAGRTELPDNLKALFRPISMMVPDYALIAEVILYSEGFESSKILSQKMVQMYKLCSEQLSQQDHYDFGMRAVKSVLVMAGSLKRATPDRNEDVVLICALRDSNLPKFLAEDATLFQGILSDLFPGIELPEQDYGKFQDTIVEVMEEEVLQPEAAMIKKVIQLHETMIVRWGVMLVGPTGGGKSTVLNTLNKALTRMHTEGIEGPYWHPVHTYTMNPKAVTAGELYGEVNPFTLEWRDGLMGIMMRTAVQCTDEDHQWIICDGPVDAVWIENLNTVLDDNKMLCLANSERIKLTPYVHMVFEVQDLAQASPATVSRCGMVYIDPDDIGWFPYAKSWVQRLDDNLLSAEMKEFMVSLFEHAVDAGLVYIKKNCEYSIHQVDISKVAMICKLIQSYLSIPNSMENIGEKSKVKSYLCQIFVFAYAWGLGGNLTEQSREKFENYVRDQFEEHPDARMPPGCDIFGIFMNVQEHRLEPWAKILPNFTYNDTVPFFEMLVPTTDTVRFGYVMERLMYVDYPVLFVGDTGVGKSVVAKNVLNRLFETNLFVPATINFSAQTSSFRTQEILEIKLEKKKKTLLGAPLGKKVIVFVDDVNMPKLETYGAQPPIELLRQFLTYGGLYDREKLFWKEIRDVIITAACAPPGGGRNPLTPRFVRHFGMLLIPPPNEFSLKAIFRAILKGFFFDFSNEIRDLADYMVNAAVEIYLRIATDLLPTPAKSHYVFNLRDLSKCIQGVLQADSGTLREESVMLRLFYHECLRVFHDRLINVEDKSYFYFLMREICGRNFGTAVLALPDEPVITNPPILLFGDFMQYGANREDRLYEEIKNIDKVKSVLQDYLDDYNLLESKDMKLIFFMDAIEHSVRIARILRSERGNALLVGVGGMGKQSLTRLSSHLNSYKCCQIELTRNYDRSFFFEDLRKMYFNAGANNANTVFLFTDTQIVQEDFLEDINNILNSGEVPNLFEADEYEKVIIAVRDSAKEAGIPVSNRDGIYDYFIKRVRNNLHVVICMSPVGDAFRRRCRMFPSLVNCCTIDWFEKWPHDALLSVAENTLNDLGDEETCSSLSTICVTMHESVEKMTERFYNEMRRHYYTTPSSYLELLKLYKVMLQTKKQQVNFKRDRIANGLQKLYETNSVIQSMKDTLIALEPVLAEKSVAVEELMINLTKEQSQADKVRDTVKNDEELAKVKAEDTQALADDAQRDLDTALPALEAATKALEALNKNDINEVKVFQKPPKLVQFVMESICLLLGAKTDWAAAKIVLGDVNFLKKLQEYDKNHITDVTLRKLKTYIDHPDFVPDKVGKVSKACKSMCMWVRAMDMYAKVFKIVEPKRKRLDQAERELNQVMGLLREKQRQLAEVEAQIAALEAKFNKTLAEKQLLEDDMELTSNRLNRAGRLNVALGDEQARWEKSIKDFAVEMTNLLGDVLIAAACVAYLGAFTSSYRVELVDMWVDKCRQFKIPATKNFSLITVLADPYDIRMWNSFGLPRDTVSTENAILVTQASRWALMIDPQEQANRWIRQMEAKNDLKIVKLTDANFMRILESAIRIGKPVLLEEVGEALDPTLAPVLMKQTFMQSGRLLIHLGDSDIEYDTNFKFYVTTKLANPHYLPEICIQVTIVNFTVTPSGLEDQLLGDVVRLERPDLEALRTELIVRINNDKTQLKAIEDKILKLLYQSEGNILDDEELIETLNESKETSAVIAARLIETEATEHKISEAREKYRTVAIRGSVLYFVIAQLAEIDPMYQYSLKYFNQLFSTVIDTSEKSTDLQKRLDTLLKEITLFVYTNVSRGLFERHKLVFSFMLCVAIFQNAGDISDTQWSFLLRGPVGAKIELPPKPNYPTITDAMWLSANFLAVTIEGFESLAEEMTKKIDIQISDFSQTINVVPEIKTKSSVQWNSNLDDFNKLLLLKTLKEEKLVFAITEYVKSKLGKAFIESPQVSLQILYQDTSNTTPLVFVLSTGSDPFGAFQRFADEMGFKERIKSISLGQGQGPVAEKIIEQGLERGDWVFLQNCHLATSWMLSMERLVLAIAENPARVHKEFRLYMSSMPSKAFPVSVLQNSVKVTNEPPKGIRANIKRAFTDMLQDFFEDHSLKQKWRSMLFGICMFHAIIQERKKFGPLGWNITYEFNDSDRDFAFNTLKMFCAEGTIPWDALEYLTASGVYYCPTFEKLEEYQEFVDSLPILEEPEIFGMHENANIAYQTKETQNIILTILESQPQASGGAEGQQTDDIVYELADLVTDSILRKIQTEEANVNMFKRDNKGRLPSLTTVLMQEVDRYNILLKLIHSSMENLKKAIKGLVVMSEALEEVYKAFGNNQIWVRYGHPASYWISGFYFPQGFLTGNLQTHARKYNLPIDQLRFDFEVQKVIIEQEDVKRVHDETEREEMSVYKGLESPSDGAIVHGLYVDAGRWDMKTMKLIDAKPGEINPLLPAVWLNPKTVMPLNDPRYVTPLYKTSVRAGVLSTTGHSTNFVIA